MVNYIDIGCILILIITIIMKREAFVVCLIHTQPSIVRFILIIKVEFIDGAPPIFTLGADIINSH